MPTAAPWAPDRRDMIWIGLRPQVGKEMHDEHPMLVLSTKAFNERIGIGIGLPMTHAQSNETNPFAVKYVGPKGEAGYVLTHQRKSFDWRARGARPHPWQLSPLPVFNEACESLDSIIDIG